ncbi:hypothetical protein ACLOJK_034092 [Asimina triloba]
MYLRLFQWYLEKQKSEVGICDTPKSEGLFDNSPLKMKRRLHVTAEVEHASGIEKIEIRWSTTIIVILQEESLSDCFGRLGFTPRQLNLIESLFSTAISRKRDSARNPHSCSRFLIFPNRTTEIEPDIGELSDFETERRHFKLEPKDLCPFAGGGGIGSRSPWISLIQRVVAVGFLDLTHHFVLWKLAVDSRGSGGIDAKGVRISAEDAQATGDPVDYELGDRREGIVKVRPIAAMTKVVYEGWMVRYGRRKIGRSYIHMRFFVLEPRLLAYYKKKPQDNVVPIKTLVIDGNCRVEDRGLKTHHGHKGGGRVHLKLTDVCFVLGSQMAAFNIQEALIWKEKIEFIIDQVANGSKGYTSFEYKAAIDNGRNASSSDHDSQCSAQDDEEVTNRTLLRRTTIGKGLRIFEELLEVDYLGCVAP